MKKSFKKLYYLFKRILIQMRCSSVKLGSGSVVRSGMTFEGYNHIGANCDLSGSIGKYTYMGNNCKLNAHIGRFCSLASNIQILNSTHPTKDFISTNPVFYSVNRQCGITFVHENRFDEYIYADINHSISCIIGNDVWIGENVLIIGGVKIGDGAIIAAGSVVTKDISDYTIVGGVPAREIKKRFDDDSIKLLLHLKWWDKDDSWLKDHAKEFDNITNLKGWIL